MLRKVPEENVNDRTIYGRHACGGVYTGWIDNCTVQLKKECKKINEEKIDFESLLDVSLESYLFSLFCDEI